MKHIWQRGNVYWFRMRCPKRYRETYGKDYICHSLATDSKAQAETSAVLAKHQVLEELEAARLGRISPKDASTHRALIGLVKSFGLAPKTCIELADEDLNEIVCRLNHLQENDPKAESSSFAAKMGGFEYPDTLVSEVAEAMPRLCKDQVSDKNPRQVRTWHNRYKRAAAAFTQSVGDKPIKNVTPADAGKYMLYWNKRVRDRDCSTEYAGKHLGYMRAMTDSYFLDLECIEYINPFNGLKIVSKPNWEKNEAKQRKPEFPPRWIQETIIDGSPLVGMNEEAQNILLIAAETGCRHAEIYDAPESAFKLDCKIPHLLVQAEIEGEDRREIKNRASHRMVPLVGAALEAAKRHPNGFPRYRGNGNFSGATNKFFKDNDLFPSKDHKISSLRHSYESRMIRAGIDNETRGFMMGHSLKRLRGREVYGDATALELRSFYAEMVAFSTTAWSPRPKEEIEDEIRRFLADQGFE
jgi:integrase